MKVVLYGRRQSIERTFVGWFVTMPFFEAVVIAAVSFMLFCVFIK